MNELKPPPPSHLYDADFFAWTNEQAQRLRALKPKDFDWENVAEEIESLGKSDRRTLRGDLRVVLEHLIEWRYQPDKRTQSWSDSLDEHRDRIDELIEESPSLGTAPREMLDRAYVKARRKALKATGLPERAIPQTCPFTVEQVLDPDYLP
jgi:hypothetical protein